jgi:hypothetical protein
LTVKAIRKIRTRVTTLRLDEGLSMMTQGDEGTDLLLPHILAMTPCIKGLRPSFPEMRAGHPMIVENATK